ncbi:MAG: hypothetical protein IJY28_07175 [Clostridia bacterium]|nr:hypothetical protein [Clostridia bacterium]
MKKRFFAGLLAVLCIAGMAVGAAQMPRIHRMPKEAQLQTPQTIFDDDLMTVTVQGEDGAKYACVGEDAMYLTGLATDMLFRPEQVCDCAAEIQIQTPMGAIGLSMKNAFVRCERGQAALTREQLRQLRRMEAIQTIDKWNEMRQ